MKLSDLDKVHALALDREVIRKARTKVERHAIEGNGRYTLDICQTDEPQHSLANPLLRPSREVIIKMLDDMEQDVLTRLAALGVKTS